LSGMVLIASAGLLRKRSLIAQARVKVRTTAFKVAKRFVSDGPELERLRERFGSSDYRSAGRLRAILVRVVREDLTESAKAVACPTLLLYGTGDTETPPEIGERLHDLIPNSELAQLEGFNHLTILSDGRHQVALRIRKFLETLNR